MCSTQRAARIFSGGTAIAKASDYRINEAIRAPQVRLVGPNGDNVGVVARAEALRIAREANLDLVEVAPNANPPVCRLLDYGKYMYELQKKAREARKAQKHAEVKEIRLRPRIGEHDLEFKLRDARRFLTKGHKVRFRVWFRGREVQHLDVARGLLDQVVKALEDVGVVEAYPRMEGRVMTMIMAPKK